MSTKMIDELHLQLSWIRLKSGKILTTNKPDQKWELLSPGIWNLEAGPDFLNAKFKINGHEIIGDVEIHKKTSDWYHHKHSGNSLYKNVVLHVVGENNQNHKHPTPDLPTMEIKPVSDKSKIASADKFPSGKCQNFYTSYPDDELYKLFTKAGIKKFQQKSSQIMESMHRDGINSAFNKKIFEACGYKHNRLQFLELFERFKCYKELESKEVKIILWGESGLLPDPTTVKLNKEMKKFTMGIWNNWWKLRKNANSKIKWSHISSRPVNSPERRLAGLISLLEKFKNHPIEILCNISEHATTSTVFIKKLREFSSGSDTLWDSYYSFTSKAEKPAKVIGKSRSDDIIINCIFPSLYAYSLITENRNLEMKIKESYLQMPKMQDNRILKTAALKWFMPPSRQKNIFKTAAAQQGAIYLYRAFCLQYCNECEKCPLNTLIKNLQFTAKAIH